MLLSNNEEFRAVRITVTGHFEGISLDRTQLLQSLYTTIDCRYVEVVQPTETSASGSTRKGSSIGRTRTFSPLFSRLNSGPSARYCAAPSS